jgi:hypothetical protein
MAQDPFAGVNGAPDGDPFEQAANVGDFPKLTALRGRLLMFQPTKLEENLVSAKYSKPNDPKLYDRLTSTVYVIDGGPVRAEDGSVFDTTGFMDMYISQTRLITQLKRAIPKGTMVLGRLDTYKPGDPAQGNPWGLADLTEEDKAAARAYIEAGYRQPGEGPNGFAPQAPAPAPVQQFSQPAAPAAPQGWGAPPAHAPAAVPGWGQPAAPGPSGPAPAPWNPPAPAGGAPVPPWGQPAQPAAAAPPWGQQ